MDFKFPEANSENVIDYHTEKQSVIIIGANGSGKSHLAAFIEKKDYEQSEGEGRGGKCLRISSQRIMNFDDYIPLKGYDEAEQEIIYGSARYTDKNSAKWYNPRTGKPIWTTKVINDYNAVLAAAFSKIHLDNDSFYEDFKHDRIQSFEEKKNNLTRDKIERIWGEIFPQKEVVFEDAKVLVKTPISKEHINEISDYNGNQMSDGERVCLYMICQVLIAPQDMLIIVDEPELHLHPSIMNRLWTVLEEYRQDCKFIYVTHDTDFAAQHQNADIIWVKSFDGKNKWDYEKLEGGSLPDALLLRILGSRKNVLFVEGVESSWEYKIYSNLLPQFYVIPETSCRDVIRATATYRENPALHHLKVFGLIDRDYRSDEDIEKLKAKGIYCLGVAEVENLFFDQDVLRCYHEMQSISEQASRKLIGIIENEVINSFKDDIQKQQMDAIASSIKYHLEVLPFKVDTLDNEEIKKNLYQHLNTTIDTLIQKTKDKFESLTGELDYTDILKQYNRKGLYSVLKRSASLFKKENQSDDNITDKFYEGYREYIVRKIRAGSGKTLRDAMSKYIPKELLAINNKNR